MGPFELWIALHCAACVLDMNSATIENAEANILARVISPDVPTLPPAVALELLKWGYSDADKQRMSG